MKELNEDEAKPHVIFLSLKAEFLLEHRNSNCCPSDAGAMILYQRFRFCTSIAMTSCSQRPSGYVAATTVVVVAVGAITKEILAFCPHVPQ